MDDIKIEISTVPIMSVAPNDYNPNKQSDRAFEAEMESIREYGMLDPITVAPLADGFVIIDGEHRWRACSRLGYTKVPVNVIHGLDDARRKKLTIILNETRGRAEVVDLAELLASIQPELGDDLGVGLPYKEDELDRLLALGEMDEESIEQFTPELPMGDKSPLTKMSFTLSTHQKGEIEKAMQRATIYDIADPSGTNENKNGNALAYVCRAFMQNEGVQ